ncbi:nitrogenase iron-molybdenum cofactor biosynthesis protein NifN [Azohydromonas caseinilytica]|uniref:Nitrogenase iron-molybdenum cofactor biosynthesis protein NifN n=1 Tax=Azohydromonas caseinilytica TaxID=2728836 RepID=A0A848F997_9BURK|nr:nitrogenase iron-molybdenum cofactor biosynthesis protein NifN [Azohydromonas caseinilytica]NML16114.1 nitrogenase iron-molybdenum cofactor biosynthesis protein NifN [Azohydromonas caseinilytica]
MALVTESRKAAAVNPLKMSQPLGASYAFMGLASCMPVMHGSQGCTSFGLVLLVRHFKEAIPLQTTAMNEATTIMGGYDNLEKALLNIRSRARPRLIAICSTGLTETKGDDVEAFVRLAQDKHPELHDTAVVYASTPDYVGAFQDGWAAAVTALVSRLPRQNEPKVARKVAVLPGCHLTPGDIEELREIIGSFGLRPVFAPDMSGSLDGHIPEGWLGHTLGGTTLDELLALGGAQHAIAIGEQMRPAAQALQARCGVPYTLFDRLTGLTATDDFIRFLSRLSGRPVSMKLRRQRSQLVDAMLDGHFHFGNVRVALGAEPDLLWAAGSFLAEMGAELSVAVTTTKSPLLERLPTAEVLIGDLEDFERSAQAAGCDLLITHSHGRQAAQRLGKPLFRLGIPMFDRIGNSHVCHVGYRGSRNFVFEVGNLLMDQIHHASPEDWPLTPAARAAAAGLAPSAAGEGVAEIGL